MIVIRDPSDIPAFASEAKEAEFWDTHELAAGLMPRGKAAAAEAAGLLPPTRPRPDRPVKSNPTSLRLGADLEWRLRVLAERKDTTYQTLLKEFVLERTYEDEKRLGTV